MPEVPDVTPGGTIQTAWGNDIRDRAIMRYASAAARDVSVPVPVDGDVAWLQDVDKLTIYDGTVWAQVGPLDELPPAVSLTGLVLSLTAGAGVNERIGILSNIDTVTYRWLVMSTGTIEAGLSGGQEVKWQLTLRETQPVTNNMQVVNQRDSVGEAIYRSVVSLHALSFTGTVANQMELVVQRDNISGSQVMRDFNLTAIPIRRR